MVAHSIAVICAVGKRPPSTYRGGIRRDLSFLGAVTRRPSVTHLGGRERSQSVAVVVVVVVIERRAESWRPSQPFFCSKDYRPFVSALLHCPRFQNAPRPNPPGRGPLPSLPPLAHSLYLCGLRRPCKRHKFASRTSRRSVCRPGGQRPRICAVKDCCPQLDEQQWPQRTNEATKRTATLTKAPPPPPL